MKKLFYVAILANVLFFSCNENKTTDEKTSADTAVLVSKDSPVAEMKNDTAMNKDMASNKAVTDKDVIDFVNKAAAGGMMEVELGEYASSNAQNQRVKDFGKMMATDHTKANNELKNLAKSNSIEVPAQMPGDMKKHVDMMKKMTGAAFDKAYMDMMVNDHKEDIAEFKKASANLKEDSYKAFATMTLPVLQKHLDSAQAIHKNM